MLHLVYGLVVAFLYQALVYTGHTRLFLKRPAPRKVALNGGRELGE